MRYLNLIWKPRGFEDEKIYIQTNADKVPQRIKRKKIHIQTNALRKVPPEIRWPIFEECLHWDGTTPALLVALRGDQKLYSEALAIFYKMNIFRVTPRNYNKLWQHKLSSNQSITRMTVDSTPPHFLEDPCFPDALLPKNTRSNNIREIHVNLFPLHLMSNQLTLFYAVAKATYALRSVKRLSATFPPVSSVVAPADRHAKPLDEALIVVTKWLGVPGKLSTVTTSNSTEWFWEEKREGKYLKWLHPTRVRYY